MITWNTAKELCNVGVTRSQIAKSIKSQMWRIPSQASYGLLEDMMFPGHNYSGKILAIIKWQHIGMSGIREVWNCWANWYAVLTLHRNLLLSSKCDSETKGNSAEKARCSGLVQQFLTLCRLQGAGREVCSPRCIKLHAKEWSEIKAPTQTLYCNPKCKHVVAWASSCLWYVCGCMELVAESAAVKARREANGSTWGA
jgi:hypothetical protein